VNAAFHAMYAREVLLFAKMYISIPEDTLEKDYFRAKCVRNSSLSVLA
jgi:hypothetical protein